MCDVRLTINISAFVKETAIIQTERIRYTLWSHVGSWQLNRKLMSFLSKTNNIVSPFSFVNCDCLRFAFTWHAASASDTVFFSSHYLNQMLILTFCPPESSIFRNGIFEWWWFDVSHTSQWSFSGTTGQILRSWNCFGIEIFAQKRNYLSVSELSFSILLFKLFQ